MDITQHNSKAWDQKVIAKSVYTQAVSSKEVDQARQGEWAIGITTNKKVPRAWFPENLGKQKILCLASGGGQQAPILAAAGADVTVVDLSEKQLEQDRFVAQRDKLAINIFKGNMTDLSVFSDEEFDMVIQPVSNLFVEDLTPVWQEISRVLKSKGNLIVGFTNPLLYLFDEQEEEKGNLVVKNSIPYSSIDNLSKEELQAFKDSDDAVEFSHTLTTQIQGQLSAGFMLTDFYEDDFGGTRPIDNYISSFIATRGIKISKI